MNRIKKIIYNTISAIFYLLSFLLAGKIATSFWGKDIWYDEVFSMVFAKKTIGEMLNLTAMDVHPPLYYIYLKAVISFGQWINPSFDTIVLGKAASLIPFVILLLTALIYIRREYGLMMSAIFAFMISLMPQISTYYVEIRMYSLAMLFISLASLCLFSIIKERKIGKKRLIIDFSLFFIFGLLTAYTQYFACVAIVGLYLVLFFFLVVNRKKEGIRLYQLGFVICAAGSVLAYLPWIPSLMKQLRGVVGSYWIQPLTLRSILGCIKYIYLPVTWYEKADYIAAILMIFASLILMIAFVKLRPQRSEIMMALAGPLSMVMIVIVGFVFSIMGHPIFVYRYMISAFGAFYLSLSYTMDYVLRRRSIAFGLLITPFIFGAYLTYAGFYFEENTKVERFTESQKALSEIKKEDVIITNFDQVTTLLDYYLYDNEIYLFEGECNIVVQKMFGRDSQLLSNEDADSFIVEKLCEGKRVLFLGSFASREEILAEWEKSGIEYEELNSILLERYWINIYELGW